MSRQRLMNAMSAASVMFLFTACGTTDTSVVSSGEQEIPEALAVVDETPTTGESETNTTGASSETKDVSEGDATSVDQETTETDSTTTTEHVAAVALTSVVLDPNSPAPETAYAEVTSALSEKTLDVFSAENLVWADGAIPLLLENSVTGDTSVMNSYLASARTDTGIVYADIEEVIAAVYLLDGVDTGPEGYFCQAWDQCPPGVTFDDYDIETTTDITVSSVRSEISAS